MENRQINPILQRISILFYIFVGLMIIGFALGVISGIKAGLSSSAAAHPMGLSALEMILTLAISILTLVISIATMIYFVKLLIEIGRSIARKNIFSLRTVKLIRSYAICSFALIPLSVLQLTFIEPGQSYMNISDPKDLSMMLSSISSVVMFLMLGQVIKIGYYLKQEQEILAQEQELTI